VPTRTRRALLRGVGCAAAWLGLLSLAARAPAAPGAAPPEREREAAAVRLMVRQLEDMGQAEAAQRLREGFERGDIHFGPIPSGDNAVTAAGVTRTTLNPQALTEIFPPHLGGRASPLEVLQWATTMVHELKHQDQDPWAWRGGFWSGLSAGRNRCEQEGWGAGFQVLYEHARRLRARLEKAPGAREKLAIAQELARACQAFEIYRNSFEAVKGEIGEISLEDREGTAIGLDEAYAEVRQVRKLAEDSAANSRILLGERRSLNGVWDVSVSYGGAKPWTSRGLWYLEHVNLRVFGRAKMTNRAGKWVDGSLQGTLKGRQLDVEVRLGWLIEVYSAPVSEDLKQVAGTTLSSNWAVAVATQITEGLPTLTGGRIAPPSEAELRKFQPIDARWTARVR
jgi:hypothetical protein